MAKLTYITKNFTKSSLSIIENANLIIDEYLDQGFDLTLRQLYYQFVARDLIPNKQSEYKRLGSIINDARLAGQIDWNAIVDRTRHVRKNTHWKDPKQILEATITSYRTNKWYNQKFLPEVWIEKDALIGVIDQTCRDFDVPFFSCRGYVSQSEMWRSAMRHKEAYGRGQTPVILHLGDHDPSGIDMSRDIEDRLELFYRTGGVKIKRLALNMNQVEKYDPPPNPTKITDSRSPKYISEFGKSSWELDALNPQVLVDLIVKEIMKLRNDDMWEKAEEEEAYDIQILENIIEGIEE